MVGLGMNAGKDVVGQSVVMLVCANANRHFLQITNTTVLPAFRKLC